MIVTLKSLKEWIALVEPKIGGDAEVHVMIETDDTAPGGKCQYEYPANDMAHDGKRMIIMHEKWMSMADLEREKEIDKIREP